MPPRFSAEIRGRFRGLRAKLDELEQTLQEYETRFQERFVPKRRSRAGGRMFLRDAAQLGVLSAHARARVLLWGVVIAVNAGLGASLFLTSRAHLETAGMLSYVRRQCQRFLAREITPGAFEEMMDRLYLGHRTALDDDPNEGIPANEQAISVLSLLESADYLVDGDTRRELRGKFREAYEWLSEFCHPNLQARLGDHVVDGTQFVFLRAPRLEESDLEMVLNYLRLSDFVVSASVHDLAEIFKRSWPEDIDMEHGKGGQTG